MNWYKVANAEGVTNYTVQAGDTLSLIAKKLLGDVNRWQEIAALNPQIKDPAKIKPGDMIKIRQTGTVTYSQPTANVYVYKNKYTVRQGDTLSGIAKKYLGSANKYDEITKINPGINPSNLQVGSVINLPDNAQIVVDSQDGKDAMIGDPLSALKEEIGSSEGSYGAYNRGKAGDTKKYTLPIEKMTIRQIMDIQSKDQVFAVGKYQFIPTTLSLIVKNAQKWNLPISMESIFDPQTQDTLFLGTLYKQPMLIGYLTGKHDDVRKALLGLAQEYASIPGPSGRGVYDGDKAGNKASGGEERVNRLIEILKKLKESGIFK